MSRLEEILSKKKLEIDELQVPEELDARLNKALENKTKGRKSKSGFRMKVAVLLIAFVLVTYNIDTLAFYGKELLGFENIMNGTLRDLNKMGMGQTIDKSFEFSNGVKVTLNGVMADDNQLIAFYTIHNPNGSVDDIHFLSNHMKGAIGLHDPEGGSGELNDDKSTIRWVEEYEPPYAFEKKLIWRFSLLSGSKSEEGEISFVLDRDKAMGHTLKARINKAIEVDGSNVKFDTITASPTTTVVKGTIKNIVELAADQIGGERLYSPNIGIRLLADGKEIAVQGTGVSTDMNGMKFDLRYDALPKDTEKLQLNLTSFAAEHQTDQLVELAGTEAGKHIQIQGQDITIERVDEIKGETFVTITTRDTVVLSKVYLLADNNKVELEETIDNKFEKKIDGTITHTRTLRFKTAAKELKLDIRRIRYEKAYDEYIDIPIE
ncbi:MAG: hypothetical protein K0R84_243 [Clostridia bacterium]|jgi:hypothetical protein|nr:hypothetical protein [Clostridia bacterium]